MNTEPPAQPSPPAARPRARVGGIALLLLALLLGGGYWYDASRKPTLLEGPLLQLDAAGRVNIVWKWTPESIPSALHWTDETGMHTVEAHSIGRGRFEATITGLRPGGDFVYSLNYHGILGQKRVLGSYFGQAPAPRGKGFRLLAFGDSGGGGNSQFDLADLMLKQGPNLIIHTGDLIYPAGDDADYALKFYEPYARLIESVPFMPSLGNHDGATDKGAPFLRHFVLPENGPPGLEPERNYWFDFGDARFVALDTNRDTEHGVITFEQMKTVVAPWLRRVLSDCDAKWKFVFFHHPPYTGSEHEAEGQAFVKEAFCAAFDETRTDIVFAGHNHLYERTAPIQADRVVPEGQGTVYITTGAGGMSRYPEKLPPPPYMRVFNDKVFSFTVVDVTADRVTLKQVDENGKTIDEYSIAKPPITASAPSAATGSPAP